MAKQKTIFVTISRGSLIRNFFHSGIITALLNEGIRVVVLSPFHDQPKYFAGYEHENLLLEPMRLVDNTLTKRVIREFLQGAVFNKTINTRLLYRITAGETEPSKLWYVPRLFFLAPLRFVPGFKKFIRYVSFKLDPETATDYLFERYKPDMVFSTAPSDLADIGVLKGAKRFKVKTVSMPKSWDNLSKSLFPVKTDLFIVWSQFMKDQALRFQDYAPQEIVMVGAPQFDTYAHTELLLSREAFCLENGLDPRKKIILYGSTGSNACREADYLELIKKYFEAGELSGAQVFIRPHVGYLKDKEQFEYLDAHPLFVLDRHDKQDPGLKDHWDVSKDHLLHLFNSLSHADVCVNVASTLTIDAVMCGTPAINIRFDAQAVPKKMSVNRLHKSDYLEAIAQTGGSWLADNEESFKEGLRTILKGEYHNEQGMENLRSYLAYGNDGKAASRVTHELLRTLAEARN